MGQTLTADKSPILAAYRANPEAEVDESVFGYVWYRSDGTTDRYINGAYGRGDQYSIYTLTAADAGKTIKVQVGFWITKSGTRDIVQLTSAPTGTVAAGGL